MASTKAVPCQEGPVSCTVVRSPISETRLSFQCPSACSTYRSEKWVLRAHVAEWVAASNPSSDSPRQTNHPSHRWAHSANSRVARHVARGSRMGAASGAAAGVRQGGAKHRHKGKESEKPGAEDKWEAGDSGELAEEQDMGNYLVEQGDGPYTLALKDGGELLVQLRAVKQQARTGQDADQPATSPPPMPPALVAMLMKDLQESTAHMSQGDDATAVRGEKDAFAVRSGVREGDTSHSGELGVARAGAAPLKGRAGMESIVVRSAEPPLVFRLQSLYGTLLKLPGPHFFAAAFVAPLALSVLFTGAYLLDPNGLTLNGQGLLSRLHAAADREETSLPRGESDPKARGLKRSAELRSPIGSDPSRDAPPVASLREDSNVDATVEAPSPFLEVGSMGWLVFTVLMFSVALSTSLQPEVVPVSPYALVLANFNALLAQLLFVFLSGAVFARLSQPSRPVQAARVAVITPPGPHTAAGQPTRLLMTRFVLTGPPPCELIDAKVDLTLAYDTRDAEGHHFRAQQALRLVRSEVAHLQFGFNVRHLIDADSPFAQRTRDVLMEEDACLTLSLVGVDRSSMQTVFHSQNYFVVDNEIMWDAEYEDVITVKEDGSKMVDHTKLHKYRKVDGL